MGGLSCIAVLVCDVGDPWGEHYSSYGNWCCSRHDHTKDVLKPRRGKATRESSVKEENWRCCVPVLTERDSTRCTWRFSKPRGEVPRSAHTWVATEKWSLFCLWKLGFLWSWHPYPFAFRTSLKSRSLSSKLNLKKQSKVNEVLRGYPWIWPPRLWTSSLA